MKKYILLTAFFASICTISSCNQSLIERSARDRQDSGITSLFVTITNGDRGTVDQPLPFSSNGTTFTVRIEARSGANRLLSNFNGYVQLSITPGVLTNIAADDPSIINGRNVRLTNGVAEGVRVSVTRAYGEVRIWAEDQGYVPAEDPSRAACANGLDDDRDGKLDYPADYGCAAPNDDTEVGASYAAATSEPIFFASPSIYDIQGGGSTSPLVNERINISRGNLVVTRISVSGFWVTDTADRSCMTTGMNPTAYGCYNSLFIFNFRLPEGLRPCDTLSELQGSVAEFVSTTQLGQPAWTSRQDRIWINPTVSGACPIPDAVTLTPGQLTSSDVEFEQYESSLVRVQNVFLSPNIGPRRVTCEPDGNLLRCDWAPGQSNCDFNGDGTIDFSNAAEGGCANTCQRTRGCSEWTNWVRFGQLAIDFASNQPSQIQRLIIAPKEAISNFDPQNQPAAAPTGVAVTGTLKQVGPNWIIEPRCTQDLALDGNPLPVQSSCLIPRTVTEEP